jgi:CHAD domain-containing protein
VSKSVSKTRAGVEAHLHAESDIAVQPPARARSAVLHDSTAGRWREFARQLARSRKRPTETAIHDLRVAMRRLMATLDIVSAVLPDDPTRRSRRQLKRFLKAFGALRDLQVEIVAARELAPRFPFLHPYLTVLMVRERLLVKRAGRDIAAMQVRSLEREVSAAGSELDSLPVDPVLQDAIRSVVFGVLGKTFARAAGMRAGAMSGKSSKIHRFRVAFKRFRYTAEALQPLLHGMSKEMLKAMQKYQVMMGEIQDIEFLIAGVSVILRARRRIAPVETLRLKEHLTERRKELIARFRESAGELDRFWHACSPPGC